MELGGDILVPQRGQALRVRFQAAPGQNVRTAGWLLTLQGEDMFGAVCAVGVSYTEDNGTQKLVLKHFIKNKIDP